MREESSESELQGSDGYADIQKEKVAEPRKWIKVLFGYAGRCRGKMVASLLFSLLSVATGFVPFLCVYKVLQLFMDVGFAPSAESITFWLVIAALAYVASKVFFGASTILSHISAYTILSSLRHDFIDKLMRTSLGTSTSKSIGAIKNVFIDRIEGVEVPLAHMIPELSGSLVLAVGIAVWLFAIDWRLALSCLVTLPIGLLVFATGLATYNKMYAAYMEQSNYVNSVIVEYIEGIEVVKAFNQTSGSYAKYSNAVRVLQGLHIGMVQINLGDNESRFRDTPNNLARRAALRALALHFGADRSRYVGAGGNPRACNRPSYHEVLRISQRDEIYGVRCR